MIALDTNILVRLIVEDDSTQVQAAQQAVAQAEQNGIPILIPTEVLIETGWVLSSVYGCDRKNIADALDVLLTSPGYVLPDRELVQRAAVQLREKGDFSDLVIVERAKALGAVAMLSFDSKLGKLFPDFVRMPGK